MGMVTSPAQKSQGKPIGFPQVALWQILPELREANDRPKPKRRSRQQHSEQQDRVLVEPGGQKTANIGARLGAQVMQICARSGEYATICPMNTAMRRHGPRPGSGSNLGWRAGWPERFPRGGTRGMQSNSNNRNGCKGEPGYLPDTNTTAQHPRAAALIRVRELRRPTIARPAKARYMVLRAMASVFVANLNGSVRRRQEHGSEPSNLKGEEFFRNR